MGVDSLATKDRVKLMIEQEELCIRCLNRHLAKKGHKLLYGGDFEDKVNKTDAFLINLADATDRSRRCAVKVRDSRDDILVAVRDPWYGPDNKNSKTGRDMLTDYFWYITRDKAKTTLRVADGKKVHTIIEDMWKEWVELKYDEKPEMRALSSKTHPGCELRRHTDAWSGRPKILGFVPPKYLGDDVWFVSYDEEEEEYGATG